MKPLDDLDRAILRELQNNARISNTDLAERVGLSASPCWQRVKRLEDAGATLGASPAFVFLTVTLPLVAPGILAGLILAFVATFLLKAP